MIYFLPFLYLVCATTIFDRVTEYKGPYTKLVNHEKLLSNSSNTEAYIHAARKLDFTNTALAIKHTAYLRDAIIPVLSRLSRSSNPCNKLLQACFELWCSVYGSLPLQPYIARLQASLFDTSNRFAKHMFVMYRTFLEARNGPCLQSDALLRLASIEFIKEKAVEVLKPSFSPVLQSFYPQPETLDDTVDYVIQQLLIFHKTTQLCLRRLEESKVTVEYFANVLLGQMISKAKYQINSLLRLLISAQTRREKRVVLGKISGYIYSLIVCDRYSLMLKGIAEPLTAPWMYLRLCLQRFAASLHRDIREMMASSLSSKGEYVDTAVLQTFMEEVVLKERILLAIIPHLDAKTKARLPFSIFDTSSVPSLEYLIPDGVMRKLLAPPMTEMTAEIYAQFWTVTGPKMEEEVIREHGRMEDFAELTKQEWTKIEKAPKASKTMVVIDLAEETAVKEVSEVKSSPEGNETKAVVVNTASLSDVITVHQNETKETNDEEAVGDDVVVDDESEEIRVYMEAFEAELAHYNNNTKINLGPTVSYVSCTYVACWSTSDFMSFYPDLAELFDSNLLLGIEDSANSMRFMWFFDPQIIIDRDTHLFLCQLFNIVEGKNRLSFRNFLRTIRQLNGQSTSKFVYRFRHKFLLDGNTYVPPIGSVHPEHRSSRFNHEQALRLLEHAGAHPYFFYNHKR